MNLVAQAIEYLGDTLEILSKPSAWTEFIIKLPVSLSITYTLVFRIGTYTLAIPTSTVVSIDRQEHEVTNDRESLYDIRKLLGITNEKEQPDKISFGFSHFADSCFYCQRCCGKQNDGFSSIIVCSAEVPF